jgi:hypothetical protein
MLVPARVRICALAGKDVAGRVLKAGETQGDPMRTRLPNRTTTHTRKI